MQLFNPQTQQNEEVPDEQAHDLYTSGKYNLPSAGQIPVTNKFGDVSAVPVGQVNDVLKDGGRITSQDALDAAVRHEKYGGLAVTAEAGAEGLASGITLGKSDAVAIAAARAYGGKEAADAMAKRLADIRAEHPYVHGVGEVVGTVGTALATGGESAIAEGAGLAEEAGRVVQLAERGATLAKPSLLSRIAGYTPAGLTTRLGRAIEGAAGDVLGATSAKSALGRIATLAIAKAPALAAEGAIYDVAGKFDEAALGGPEVTGQKLVAAIGHGALWNTILGEAGEGLVHAGGSLWKKASPYLDRAANEKAFDMLGSAAKSGAKEVEELGGAKAIGAAVQKHLDLGTGGLQETISQGLLTPDKIVPKLDEAILKQTGKIEDASRAAGVDPGAVMPNLPPEYPPEVVEKIREQVMGKAKLPPEVQAMSKELEQLKLARDLASKSEPVEAGSFAPSGASIAHAAIHPTTGIPHMVLSAAKNAASGAAKEHQAAVAATLLSKISKLDFIARAVNQVDTTMRTGIEAAIMGKSAKFDSKFSGPDRNDSPESKWEHSRNYGSTRALATTEHLDQIIPQLSVHAPKIAQAAVQAMNQGVMIAKLSQPKAINKPTLSDPNPTPRVSTTDAEEHYEKVRAIEDPATTLSAGFAEGRLNPLQIKAIEGSSPDLLEDFKKQILDTLSKPHPPLKDAQIRCLEYLFNGQGDELSDPQMGMMLQKTYQQPSEPATRPAVAPSRVKPVTGTADATKTQLQKVSDRR